MNKKARIDSKIVDIIPNLQEYYNNQEVYKQNYTAIQVEGLLYPLRGVTDIRPGIYQKNSYVSIVKEVPEEENINYSSDNIIDFDNIENIRDAINKQTQLRGAERYILETPDHITITNVSQNCTAQMRCLKEAINCKSIDFDKYEQRFGNNFNNDKRLLEKDDITLNKLTTICEALDIKATLILEDASENVPNPMNKSISVELTSGGEEYD